jgi:hypothetical protein
MIEKSGGTFISALERRVRQARYTLRYLLSGYPAIHVPFTRLRYGSRSDRLVDRSTDLVIEGFGRSGNTFAVVAFELAQGRQTKVVHHTHAPAQVIRAVKLHIPVVLLVREPVATVVSHMLYREVSARAGMSAWVRYHTRILPYRSSLVIAPFEETTNDLAGVVKEVNQRYGTSFDEFRHTSDNVQRVFQRIEELNRRQYGRLTQTISRPNPERDDHKRLLLQEVLHDRLTALRRRAEQIYGLLLEKYH